MNDEDWGLIDEKDGTKTSYQNTVSSERNGKIGYATADVGYDVLRGSTYKVGPFVGYNYYTQQSDSFGCVQIANPMEHCLDPGNNRIIGTQDTTWNSLRVGVSTETMLFDRWKISADVAYLPYTDFTGRDNHLLRPTTTYFDQTGTGQGVQLEGIVSYFVTSNFSVGAGGRYWGLWTTNGSFTCTGCTAPGVTLTPNAGKYSTERWGTFLQASYKFEAFSAPAAVVTKY